VSGDAIKGPVRRRNHGRGHSYYDADGNKVPGVTTIIGNGTPKQALIEWAGNATAAYAVDHWDELSELPPSQRLKKLQRARYEDRDAAANRGTQVHELAERLVQGEQVDVPEEIAGHVESYVAFLDDFDVQPIAVEFVVVSYRFGWAGTGDLIADLIDADDPERRVRWGLDIKTSRSGIFGEVAWQLVAGYFAGADAMITADGEEQPLPEVERYGAVHVRADGYDLFPLDEDPQRLLRELRYIHEVAKAVERAKDYVGAPIRPPARRKADVA
jgi:hypothetical protein